MDDVTLGRVVRALRRRRDWRQSDLAAAVGCSQALISRIEAGHLSSTSLDVLRRILGIVEARLTITATWRGAELDRLIDADHAALAALVARRLEQAGWDVFLEVTYGEFGDRGSIDVLGLRPAAAAAIVTEVKTDLPSAEATGRKLDEKARLVPTIVQRRWGWRPTEVGRLLVLPDTGRLRRLVARVEILRRMLPDDVARARSWLRRPDSGLAGIVFLPLITPRNARRRIRVRAAAAGPGATGRRAGPAGTGASARSLPAPRTAEDAEE